MGPKKLLKLMQSIQEEHEAWNGPHSQGVERHYYKVGRGELNLEHIFPFEK